jgi:hypothetical protein
MSKPLTKKDWLNRPAWEMWCGLEAWLVMKATAELTPSLEVLPVKASSRAKHRSGQMNGLEKRYAQHLHLRKMTGEITDYRFEEIRLVLAPRTSYWPDFCVVMPDNTLEIHETKGHWEDDAKVKIKVAAKMFPFFKFVAVLWDKRNKVWKFEEFRAL